MFKFFSARNNNRLKQYVQISFYSDGDYSRVKGIIWHADLLISPYLIVKNFALFGFNRNKYLHVSNILNILIEQLESGNLG